MVATFALSLVVLCLSPLGSPLAAFSPKTKVSVCILMVSRSSVDLLSSACMCVFLLAARVWSETRGRYRFPAGPFERVPRFRLDFPPAAISRFRARKKSPRFRKPFPRDKRFPLTLAKCPTARRRFRRPAWPGAGLRPGVRRTYFKGSFVEEIGDQS